MKESTINNIIWATNCPGKFTAHKTVIVKLAFWSPACKIKHLRKVGWGAKQTKT